MFASAWAAKGQYATSLHENFDVACATSAGFPGTWLKYNPPSTANPQGEWHCRPLDGRPNSVGTPTPGTACTGVWSGTFHLDTSYLISPHLYLASYTTAFLTFDTRADSLSTSGARLAIMYTHDTGTVSSFVYIDTSGGVTPTMGLYDASGWVTHQLSLSMFCGISAMPFYIAFRYTSGNTTGSMWYLDNVNINPASLNLQGMEKDILPITVIGQSTTSEITIAIGARHAATHEIFIYDMMGKVVCNKKIELMGGTKNYKLDGLDLIPGMYFIKIGDGRAYGSQKVIVQ
ncbi:MAG: Secretion system C-terminal sorting domain [Flavipsychrobacter sp.]|jgi:hypothetical protein|nr:Secretion system C-terminal sorting domain [Flavipsychrobacter sp.]